MKGSVDGNLPRGDIKGREIVAKGRHGWSDTKSREILSKLT